MKLLLCIVLTGLLVTEAGIAQSAAQSQAQSPAQLQKPESAHSFYRIDARTVEGLHELFRFSGGPVPIVSAHRGGARAGFPENCIATFEETIRHTFAILEVDLRYSKDGEIVLHHDATLDRTTTGTGPIDELTLDELKSLRLKDPNGIVTAYQIPTLDEALQWARGKTILVLDKKDVPVQACVVKIEQHRAQAHTMVMAYSFQEVLACHQLNPNLMMEVMIGNRQRFREFSESDIPWNRVIVFVGHMPPHERELLNLIHANDAYCMAGTSRNLDRKLLAASEPETAGLEGEYRALLDAGVDVIETDLPIDVGRLLYATPAIVDSKSPFLHLPE